jgi:hypothetical protein
MKVIFLDNDGVICLQYNWGTRNKKWSKYRSVNPNSSKVIREVPVEIRFDNFDKKSIDVLNSILKETDAEIVVSSDWRRHATLEELGDYYEAQGIIKRPIGMTEEFHFTNWVSEGFIPDHGEFPWDRYENLEQHRYFEILRWLRDNPEVTHWVAIDDLNMGKTLTDWRGQVERSWGLENFVHTPKSREGIKQCGKREKILQFLKQN